MPKQHHDHNELQLPYLTCANRRYVRISPGRYLRQQRAYGIFCALNGGTGSLPFELFGHWWHSTADGMPRWERSGDAPLMCAAMG
jgi:hypothetical protein